jgi:hypothetical protein
MNNIPWAIQKMKHQNRGVHRLGKPTWSGQTHPIQSIKAGWVGQVGGYEFQK